MGGSGGGGSAAASSGTAPSDDSGPKGGSGKAVKGRAPAGSARGELAVMTHAKVSALGGRLNAMFNERRLRLVFSFSYLYHPVRLSTATWPLRSIPSPILTGRQTPSTRPLCIPQVVNSAYFSPVSGRKVLTTCQVGAEGQGSAATGSGAGMPVRYSGRVDSPSIPPPNFCPPSPHAGQSHPGVGSILALAAPPPLTSPPHIPAPPPH